MTESITSGHEIINKDKSVVFIDLFKKGVFQIRYKIKSKRILIGGSKNCGVLILEEGIDDIYAKLNRGEENELLFEKVFEGLPDTYLNNTKVVKTNLRNGDRLTIGSVELFFSFVEVNEEEEETNLRLELANSKAETNLESLHDSHETSFPFEVQIYLLQEGKKYKPINISGKVFVIGSKYGELKIPDANISQKHASIEKYNQKVFLNDLASEGGTFLNRNKIIRHELHDGDIFKIASYQFEVKITSKRNESSGVTQKSIIKAVDVSLKINLNKKSKKGILMESYSALLHKERLHRLFKLVVYPLLVFIIIATGFKVGLLFTRQSEVEVAPIKKQKTLKSPINNNNDINKSTKNDSKIEKIKSINNSKKEQEKGRAGDISDLIDSYSFDVKYKAKEGKSKKSRNRTSKLSDYKTDIKDIDIEVNLTEKDENISIGEKLKELLKSKNNKLAQCFVNARIRTDRDENIVVTFLVEKKGSISNVRIKSSPNINEMFKSCAKKVIKSIKLAPVAKSIDVSYDFTIRKSGQKIGF